tara:strand:- start:294 stop:539 length:246 start_codon:yes stop_codon:yes gene_type:complete
MTKNENSNKESLDRRLAMLNYNLISMVELHSDLSKNFEKLENKLDTITFRDSIKKIDRLKENSKETLMHLHELSHIVLEHH